MKQIDNDLLEINPVVENDWSSNIHSDIAQYPFLRSTKAHNNWSIRQDIPVMDLQEANDIAKALIQEGVSAVGFKIQRSHANIESLQILLKDIDPTAVEIHFACCQTVVVKFTEALAAYYGAHPQKDAIKGTIDFNPFKKQLVKGVVQHEWIEKSKLLMALIQPLKGIRLLHVDAALFANAGVAIDQQVGYALAWGKQLLDTMMEQGFSVEKIASRIYFSFGVGVQCFKEVAKFRAVRSLWAQIINAYDQSASDETKKIYLLATNTTWNKSIYDDHMNLLRAQTELMAMAAASVNCIRVLPFDATYQIPEPFALRLARNAQLMLKAEGAMDQLVDPFAGSYYMEEQTAQIMRSAWGIFTQIVKEGGFAKLANLGWIQSNVNMINQKRHEALESEREWLVGINCYPDLDEKALEKAPPASDGKGGCGCGKNASLSPIDQTRGASAFEEKRFDAERQQ